MSDDPPKLRLKPRLAPDNPAPSVTPAPPSSSEASSPDAAPADPAPAPAAEPAPPAPPTIRFKPRSAPAAPPATAAPAAPPPLPPPPLPAAGPVPTGTPSLPREDPARAERAAATAHANPKLKLIAAGLCLGGVLLLSAIGFVVYGRRQAHQRQSATSSSPGTNGQTARISASQAAPLTSPAASAAAPASDANAPATKSAPAATGSAASAAASIPASSTGPSEPPAPPAEPNPASVAWVRSLRITGLRKGAAPRILVERATYSVGDLLNAELGITFAGYDASRGILKFKDKNGALIERRERN